MYVSLNVTRRIILIIRDVNHRKCEGDLALRRKSVLERCKFPLMQKW